jgi:hypothetical protein
VNGYNNYPNGNSNRSVYYHPYAGYIVHNPHLFSGGAYGRIFPPVKPGTFMEAAKVMETILRDAEKIVHRIAVSREFSVAVMNAAQESKPNAVNELLRKIGIRYIPKVSYNPDGLYLEFFGTPETNNCCHLVLMLKWK